MRATEATATKREGDFRSGRSRRTKDEPKAVAPAVYPTPPGAFATSVVHPCAVCERKWNVRQLIDLADGTIADDPYRVFSAGRFGIVPEVTRIVEIGRECVDIWPIPGVAIEVWICPSCWVEAELTDATTAQRFVFEELDWETRETAAEYAARMIEEDAVEDLAAPAYAEYVQEEMIKRPLAPVFQETPLELEDDESIRREVANYCKEHGPTMPKR